MIEGLYYGSRSLDTRSKNIESVAGNLANINTTGYKRQLPFSEVLLNTGEVLIKQYTDFSQGELVSTGNQLDAAISGEGYFVLRSDEGEEYTRSGKFKISSEGYIVNDQGFKVIGKSGEINIQDYLVQGKSQIQINSSGEIKIDDAVIDSLKIVKLNSVENMLRTSGLNFLCDDVTELNENEFEIHQGYLEESNVNPVIEMESMIMMNNEFESAHKVMKYLDQSLGQANEIGKV